MGKRFDREVADIPNSLKRAFTETLTTSFREMVSGFSVFPLLVVGSGGSFSAAHFVARLHEEMTGQTARALTPLEFVFCGVNPGSHGVLLLTASGNNKDIISAFDHAIRREFVEVGILCMTVGSKILRKCQKYSHVHALEYSNPSGRDGFLAVNSFLSTCVLVARAYGALDESTQDIERLVKAAPGFRHRRWEAILSRRTIVALGGEWAWPALVDLESKFTEAALGNVLISDFRNFAHGRHNWFDKRRDESALLVLETPRLARLAKRTMELLPEDYPGAVLRSPFQGPLAGIDLCKQIIHFVDEAGKMVGIDPGRPRVPEFGRKIYHVGLSLVATGRRANNRRLWIQRKTRVSNESTAVYEKSLREFLKGIQDTKFLGVVFDYDGTLCDPPERFKKPRTEIAAALGSLLSKGIPIGLATGRGGSVQKSLRSVIDEAHWDKVLVGNYNGSVVLPLRNEMPSDVKASSRLLQRANKLIHNDLLLSSRMATEVRAEQLSIVPKERSLRQFIFSRLTEVLASELKHLKIVQSGHSIDILHPKVTKLHLVEALASVVKDEKGGLLIVGDQGQYGGNDFEMLSLPYSLSVDKVSSSPTTCWNLSPVGLRGAAATLSLIKAFDVGEKHFHLNVKVLEEEAS